MTQRFAALLIGAIAAPLLAQQPSHKPSCETIQFRFEREGAPPTSRHFVRPDTNLRVALNYAAIIDGRDIASLGLEPTYGDTARRDIIATLTPQGAAALAKETRAHVGRHLGITVGNDLTNYAVIVSATGPVVALAQNLDRAKAAALMARAERARKAKCPE